jgi:hypothetical protein
MKKAIFLVCVSFLLVGCSSGGFVSINTNIPLYGNVVVLANETNHLMLLYVDGILKIMVDSGDPPKRWRKDFIGGGGIGGYDKEVTIMIVDAVTKKVFQRRINLSGIYKRSFGYTVKSSDSSGGELRVNEY